MLDFISNDPESNDKIYLLSEKEIETLESLFKLLCVEHILNSEQDKLIDKMSMYYTPYLDG